MISINSIIFLILIRVITNVHSQSSTGDVLGQSACEIFGVIQATCKLPDVPIESYPDGCSSYIYSGIGIVNNTLIDLRAKSTNTTGNLDKLLETNKNVIAYYFHMNVKDWCAAIQPNNTAGQTKEINNLKTFLDQHKGIKGFVLGNLIVQDDQPSACPDYNQNLKSYIDLMKNTFTDLSFGINIYIQDEIDNFGNPELPWLDFKVLDCSVDFYMLSVNYINDCSDEFLKTGQYPLTGNYNATVDKVRTLIEKAGATSSKVHYKFSVYGEFKDDNSDFCKTFVSSYCKNQNDTKTTMCADTIQSLYEKGVYAKKHGAGFIVNSIDTDDFDCSCQCGQSYPGFNAVLSGFNGGPPPPPCALFDRT